MTLSSFFVGSRQFFGFLTPGFIWIMSILVLVTQTNPFTYIVNLTFLALVVLLAMSFVVGTAVETISFYVAVSLSATLYKSKVYISSTDTDYTPLTIDALLLSQVSKIIKMDYNDPPLLAWLYVDSNGPITKRRVAQFCRRYILETSKCMGRRVVEYEDEINLISMLVLPLLVSSCCWIVHVLIYFNGLGVGGQLVLCTWALLPLTVSGLCVYRLDPLRREEAEFWFEAFIMLNVPKIRLEPKTRTEPMLK